MGQKTNPISNRLGIVRGWDSSWFGKKANVAETIYEDHKLRTYLNARLTDSGVARIVIERTLKLITITICTARPGRIIGPGGSEVDKLKEELKKITDKEVQINIFEVRRPDMEAAIVADSIARQIEGRVNYRRAARNAIGNAMRAGAEGVKVLLNGRLNNAEMARSETFKEGRIPLHTFRADIDYAMETAHTKVGAIGVKVWICRGEVYGKKDLTLDFSQPRNEAGRGAGRGGRNDRGGRRGGARGGRRGGRGGRRNGGRTEGGAQA